MRVRTKVRVFPFHGLKNKESFATYTAPVMQKIPETQVSPDPPHQATEMDDFELAKMLQEEENARFSNPDVDGSLNGEQQNYADPYAEGVRPPDQYRQERLIPDPADEEAAEQEFIRQQQILYAQYSQNNNRNNNPNNNQMNNNAGNYHGAQGDNLDQYREGLLNQQNMRVPGVGRVNREI